MYGHKNVQEGIERTSRYQRELQLVRKYMHYNDFRWASYILFLFVVSSVALATLIYFVDVRQ